jgi:hypothetical protein
MTRAPQLFAVAVLVWASAAVAETGVIYQDGMM